MEPQHVLCALAHELGLKVAQIKEGQQYKLVSAVREYVCHVHISGTTISLSRVAWYRPGIEIEIQIVPPDKPDKTAHKKAHFIVKVDLCDPDSLDELRRSMQVYAREFKGDKWKKESNTTRG
jgi:hypothetical protein